VLAGAIFQDRTERLRTIANVRNFYNYVRTIPGRNVFVIGGFYHGIGLIAPESEAGHFVYLFTANELRGYIKEGIYDLLLTGDPPIRGRRARHRSRAIRRD
jgi:hypothetical protein